MNKLAKQVLVNMATINFVGPDPHTSHKFYGTITVGRDNKITVK